MRTTSLPNQQARECSSMRTDCTVSSAHTCESASSPSSSSSRSCGKCSPGSSSSLLPAARNLLLHLLHAHCTAVERGARPAAPPAALGIAPPLDRPLRFCAHPAVALCHHAAPPVQLAQTALPRLPHEAFWRRPRPHAQPHPLHRQVQVLRRRELDHRRWIYPRRCQQTAPRRRGCATGRIAAARPASCTAADPPASCLLRATGACEPGARTLPHRLLLMRHWHRHRRHSRLRHCQQAWARTPQLPARFCTQQNCLITELAASAGR